MAMQQKIGEGHAEAMLRLGLKELRNALNPSKESVADSEIGLFGTKTQGEIAESRDYREEGVRPESELPGRDEPEREQGRSQGR
jgi:hypothetical protein